MRVNKHIITKWANALRSGKYKQTKHTLQDVKGYCCLGVACDLFIPNPRIGSIDGYLYGSHPIAQPNAPKWLHDINEDFFIRTGMLLSQLNDDGISVMTIGNGTDFEYTKINSLTFDEIADLLEAVYIHKFLD